ncbi:hypothetical protein [Tabrizicola sp.]|uniref:hypothetical protein n=1 Tax=Tabrizicola sp. TaxID=2005166 RepID=UPI003F3C2300
MTKTKTRRVQMDLPENSFSRLERLKASTDASSYSVIMKDAIRIFEFLVIEQEAGSRFFIEDKDGEKRQIQLFI